MTQLSPHATECLDWVNQCLKRSLQPTEQEPPALTEVMGYSLLAGGKRLRPLLAVAGAEAMGYARQRAEELVVALECLHTYSLVHDDLPAMDDDDLRRGKPTAHRAFGEDMAILAGDALLTRAFELLSSDAFIARVGAERCLSIIRHISRAVGAGGMVGGQVLDIKGSTDQGLEALKALHRLKTGALIRVSVVCGGLVGGAGTDDISRLTRYGEHLGLAFQIIDDVLDVTASTAQLGKPQGSDSRNGKATYVDLLGLEEAKASAKRLTQQALDIASHYGSNGQLLRELALLTLNRGH